MQEEKIKKNKKIYKALSAVFKELKGKKKISEVAYESDLPRSVVHYIQQSVKDPQLTTLWRLAEGFNLRPSEFLKLIEEKLPENWTILDE